MSERKHTHETRKKISDGVKRHYENMTEEDNELRKKRIAEYRKTESKAYKFLMNNKALVKRLYEELKEKEQQDK